MPSNILSHNTVIIILSRKIHWYSTAATDEAAYIIGGPGYSDSIAEFKNEQWRKLGNLTQGRQVHGSISIGQRTMVLGENTGSG